jgi:hypothetical protein
MRVGGKAFRSIWLGDDGVCVEIDQTLLPHEPAEILGAAGSVVTFIMTVTIIPFMPSGWAESAGGFPAMTLDDKVANHSTLPEAVGTAAASSVHRAPMRTTPFPHEGRRALGPLCSSP